MNFSLKQLFCKHIWKTEKVEELGPAEFMEDLRYNYYVCDVAKHVTCLKCNKKDIHFDQTIKDMKNKITKEKIF